MDDIDNLSEAVNELGRKLNLNLDSPSWERSRRPEITTLLLKGTDHLRQMVFRGRGSVGLSSAARFARDKSPEEQDAATIEMVRGYGDHPTRRAERAADPTKLTRKAQREKVAEWRQRQNEAAINAALARAGKPRVSDEEFERPPPELIDQQYPGRAPGVTYAKVHRETHGPIWHNVQQRRRQTLERKLKDLAIELEKTVADFAILEPESQASVRKRWRIAAKRIRDSINLSEVIEGEVEDQEPLLSAHSCAI